MDFAGAKTNRRLFRPAASRPVTDGHESSPDRPQSGIIEKSGGYFCVEARQNPNESLYSMSCGRRHETDDKTGALRSVGSGATSGGGFKVKG